MSKHEIHAGYEFESGMFSRMRSWVDVASWVRLLRILRVLASPTHVGLVLIAWIVSRLLIGWDTTAGIIGAVVVGVPPWAMTSLMFDTAADFFVAAGWIRLSVTVMLLIAIWVPTVQLVCRGGAALATGNPLPALGHSFAIARPRFWRSLLVVIAPWGAAIVFAILVYGIRIPVLAFDSQWLSRLSGCLLGVAAFPIGILGFGALFAIPLGLAAMVVEKDPDPIDSLSRGYEYLFRRPLQLIWYVGVSALLVFVASCFLRGVGWSTSLAVQIITSVFANDDLQRHSAVEMISMVLCAWICTLAFALLGGIYLLLRCDAGGQEAEDFWIPAAEPSERLPALPKEAFES